MQENDDDETEESRIQILSREPLEQADAATETVAKVVLTVETAQAKVRECESAQKQDKAARVRAEGYARAASAVAAGKLDASPSLKCGRTCFRSCPQGYISPSLISYAAETFELSHILVRSGKRSPQETPLFLSNPSARHLSLLATGICSSSQLQAALRREAPDLDFVDAMTSCVIVGSAVAVNTPVSGTVVVD